MAYTVNTQAFQNGNIIDADDFLNEFGAIASEFSTITSDFNTKITQILAESKRYTDVQVATVPVDGGSF